jgi:hypothetical protein
LFDLRMKYADSLCLHEVEALTFLNRHRSR